MDIRIKPTATTDDRPPTMYFKIKTHKPTFHTNQTEEMEIYTYTNGAKELTPISRPIINHRNSVTTHCSKILRDMITPIINNSDYLTKDVHDTISKLCKDRIPEYIYTGDIEQFYPNTPHSLVIEALHHYHPNATGELQILRRLLDYNYTTNGQQIYFLGTTGIPMGLPLAPELARMCTAYLLRNYHTPENESLTIYFDDVAATYPIDNLPLAPYTLKATEPNTTQDCKLDITTNTFKPIQQQYRQPVLLHPESYHPSKKMTANTYISSAFRASRTATDPADCLEYLLLKYIPALIRNGHNAKDTITKLFQTSYFPTNSTKKEWEYKPIIKYTWSNTRPTKTQMLPITIKDYHLIPNLPLASLKSILSYQPPHTEPIHEWQSCSNHECIMCTRYSIQTTTHLPVPITPCNLYRCVYLLHHPNDTTSEHLFIGTTLRKKSHLENQLTNDIAEHLCRANIRWQILSLYSASYTTPHKAKDEKVADWNRKLHKQDPTAIIHEYPKQKEFYNKWTT